MLLYIWYFCTANTICIFPSLPTLELHKLFYGEAEGAETGGKVKISQDPASDISGAPEGARDVTFLIQGKTGGLGVQSCRACG